MIDSTKIALQNIMKRKKRAILTIIGIFIGISAVVALISLGQGLQDTINAQFEKVGADKIIIQSKEIGFGGQNVQRPLTRKEIDLVGDVYGVINAAGSLFSGVNVVYNDLQRTVYAISVPEKKDEEDLMTRFNTWEADDGRLLTHKDTEKVIVGHNLANKKTFLKNIRTGDKIEINGKIFEVMGILKRTGDPTMDGGIGIAEEDLRSILKNENTYSYIVAQSEISESPEEVVKRIEKVMRRERHLKEGKEDFNVQTSTELIASFNSVLNIIQAVFAGIAAISLLVGGIGIMNTMYTAVLERTNEIGVMKAIGAKNSDIMKIFLIESGVLGIAGGIAGIVIGILISKTVEIGANSAFGPGTIYASFSPQLIIGMLLFSFLVGSVSGMLPAVRASKLKPVDALRYE